VYIRIKNVNTASRSHPTHFANPEEAQEAFAKMAIGSSTYYLVKSILPDTTAPNPNELYDLAWISDTIPKKGDLRGYVWADTSWVKEITEFKDNDDAAQHVLRKFDDDILRF
jgi:hypothetical protein